MYGRWWVILLQVTPYNLAPEVLVRGMNNDLAILPRRQHGDKRETLTDIVTSVCSYRLLGIRASP